MAIRMIRTIRLSIARERHEMRELVAPLAIYGAMAALAVAIAFVRGKSPIATTAALPISPLVGQALSVVLGVGLAVVTIGTTRYSVRHWGWARVLHGHLQPAVRGISEKNVVVLGALGGASEELFFRGLLTMTLGLWLSSLAFGLLHQAPGRARWIWAAWATVMGFFFGLIFLATGSLLGSIVSHIAINVVNLRFLRDTDLEPPKPRLGGLLG